jgi:hypothetical protein
MLITVRRGDARGLQLILAAGTPGQKLCDAWIGGHESISLLTVVAAIKADGNGVAVAAEYPPHPTRVFPSAQLSDKIRAWLHGTCIPLDDLGQLPPQSRRLDGSLRP